jgi:ribosomal protein S18 acetylase RimI-like enzyme
MTLTLATPSHLRPPQVRRFDINRDLNSVANLIEQCFAATLDADGRRYIRQMRSSARNPRFLRWAANLADMDSMPMAGFVWEEDDHLVGNLSMIRAKNAAHRTYLIANVAVHPDYRRRGIAKALTKAALRHAQDQHAYSIWLHVREDNQAAVDLYTSMQFAERARRTTWRSFTPSRPQENAEELRVLPRLSQHWSLQSDWLDEMYPQSLRWYLPLTLKEIRPGFFGALSRLFAPTQYRHWSALRGQSLTGVLTWQKTYGATDRLWLATSPRNEASALLALLPHARQHLSTVRPLDLDYPAHQAAEIFSQLGFRNQQTLIWMQYKP